MAEMRTDAAALTAEARNFDRIAGELKEQIAKVESTASALSAQWRGQAGAAAQAALVRFQQAAARQITELNDISSNIHAAGGQYAAADEEHHHVLAAQMQF